MSGGPGDRPLLLPWQGSPEACRAAFAERKPCWVLWGGRLRTKATLLAEWAAAVPFPAHFGATWDALRDALSDLPEGGTFLVLEAHQLFQDAPPRDFTTLIAVLRAVREDQAPKPFQVVLQAEGERYEALVQGILAMGMDPESV